MTHDEFVFEIHKLTLAYQSRVADEILARLDSAFPGSAPPPPTPRIQKPTLATTSTVKMPAEEAKKNIARMAKAEGMTAPDVKAVSDGRVITVPGAKVISEGHDTKLHHVAKVLLTHVKKAPGISPGALSRMSGIPSTTVRDHMKKLVAANAIVKKTGRTKYGVGVLYYPAAR